MGVEKLTSLIYKNLKIYDPVEIKDTGIIIDGAGLYYFLYYKSAPKLDQRCGGDYSGFKDEVCKFFETLEDCNITPYVILDGGSDSVKKGALESRLEDKLKKAKTVAETDGPVKKGCDVLPPLIKDVFIEILKDEGIMFHQCLGEADPEVVSAANQNDCAVLSWDTDFCIYDVKKGFLHLENFKWKRKKDGKIPAKLYTLSKFCSHFKLDPAVMPVFAAIAGNDYSRLADKGKFAQRSSLSAEPNMKRLDGLLSFLREVNLENLDDSEKRERALREAVNHARNNEDESFRVSIQKYVTPEKPRSELPLWMCEKLRRGELTTFITSVVEQKTMMLTPLVEDFSQDSSYKAAERIRRFFYGLLIGTQQCTEYDRAVGRDVEPILPNVSREEQEKLQLQSLNEACNCLRQRVFEEALEVQISALKKLPPRLKLPVCVTIFWFKRLQQDPDPETVLHALLLGFVFDPEGPENNFEWKMKALKEEDLTEWHPRVAHAFSQWQCCMRQSLHLNQLLCFPLPEPQCARLYCGPLLHQLANQNTIEEVKKTLTGEQKKLYRKLKASFPPLTEDGSSQSSSRGAF